jgi:hypothetical protein
MYYLFILAIGAERLVELVVSRRNANWSFANGGKEFGRGHYPVMIGMHTLLLVCCIAEVALLHRPFIPWLGWPMVVLVALSTVLRWWCVATLGKHWNPRLIVISPQLHGGDRGGGCATPCACGVADGNRVHHRQRPGAQCADPLRERSAGLRVTVGPNVPYRSKSREIFER